MSLPIIFKPKKNYKLKRIGRDNDGGYLVGNKSLISSKTLISLGINDDWSFEKNFLIFNKVNLFCYDDVLDKKYLIYKVFTGFIKIFYLFKLFYFVSSIKKFLDFFDFFKKHELIKEKINEKNFLSLISKKDVPEPIFFKIDIEGSEYEILNNLIQIRKKISGIIIEFHNISSHMKEIEYFIQNIDLKLTHIHANNFGDIDVNDNPNIIELTFERNPEISNDIELELPNILDQKNNLDDKEILIKFTD
tara:strand:+ start:515 stop:1258 length:744 start_codon:yes stop_codon:yes gene_type:complete